MLSVTLFNNYFNIKFRCNIFMLDLMITFFLNIQKFYLLLNNFNFYYINLLYFFLFLK